MISRASSAAGVLPSGTGLVLRMQPQPLDLQHDRVDRLQARHQRGGGGRALSRALQVPRAQPLARSTIRGSTRTGGGVGGGVGSRSGHLPGGFHTVSLVSPLTK